MRQSKVLGVVLAGIVMLTAGSKTAADTGDSLSNWYMLPAVAHMPGKNGTFWRTDVAIVNPYTWRKVELYLWFFPEGGNNSAYPFIKRVEIAPGGQVVLTDVVSSLFGFSRGSGSIVLRTTDGASFTVNARTYTGEERTFGMMEAGQKHLTTGGKQAIIAGVRNDPLFRTNVGVASASSREIEVVVGAFDNEGRLEGETVLNVKPWSTMQIGVRSFAPAFSRGYLTLAALNPAEDVRWMGYATTIDNTTGDSAFSEARTDDQYTWAQPRHIQSGWWRGSMSSAQGSANGYLLIDQDHSLLDVWVYDSDGVVHSRISGYSHGAKIYITELNVFDAVCMKTRFVDGDITSESDAIFGIVTVSAENSEACIDGTITLYYSALENPPFDSSTESSESTVASAPILETSVNGERPE